MPVFFSYEFLLISGTPDATPHPPGGKKCTTRPSEENLKVLSEHLSTPPSLTY
jgi:hypothetical protein